jgi:hypothetical protein
MGDHEKAMQIGNLATDYSRLRGELNHVEEKLKRAQLAAQFFGHFFPSMVLRGGNIAVLDQTSRLASGATVNDFPGLLSHAQVLEAFEERQRLGTELGSVAERLRALAPHLV